MAIREPTSKFAVMTPTATSPRSADKSVALIAPQRSHEERPVRAKGKSSRQAARAASLDHRPLLRQLRILIESDREFLAGSCGLPLRSATRQSVAPFRTAHVSAQPLFPQSDGLSPL